MVKEKPEQIYIVITQTGTVLSRILKFITGADYNHVSIGLSGDLQAMYSFGRKHPYNPFWGGFVTESPNFGTFKRFRNTEAIILALNIGQAKHQQITDMINEMILNRKKYHYNYVGLLFAAFNIYIKGKNRYYCSEFVKYILSEHNIEGSDKLSDIVKPISFMDIPCTKQIYSGRLKDYSEFYNKNTEPQAVLFSGD